MAGVPHYSAEVKASVLAAVMAGAAMSDVARQFSLPRQTVLRWKNESWRDRGAQDDVSVVSTAHEDEMRRLQLRCRCLSAELLAVGLESVKAQLKAYSCTDWLRQQTAEGAAELLGATTDTVLRIAEAVQPPDAEDGAATNDPA